MREFNRFLQRRKSKVRPNRQLSDIMYWIVGFPHMRSRNCRMSQIPFPAMHGIEPSFRTVWHGSQQADVMIGGKKDSTTFGPASQLYRCTVDVTLTHFNRAQLSYKTTPCRCIRPFFCLSFWLLKKFAHKRYYPKFSDHTKGNISMLAKLYRRRDTVHRCCVLLFVNVRNFASLLSSITTVMDIFVKPLTNILVDFLMTRKVPTFTKWMP